MDKQIKLFLEFLQNDKKLSNNTLQSYRRDIMQFRNYVNKTRHPKGASLIYIFKFNCRVQEEYLQQPQNRLHPQHSVPLRASKGNFED